MNVSVRRRVSTLLFGLLASLVAVVGLSLTAASAAPYGTTTATVGLSTTAPCAGGTMSASGSGFGAGESVSLVLNSEPQSAGTVQADADGRFSASVTIPAGLTGRHVLTATGASTGSVTSGSFTIVASCDATPVAAQGSSGGGLAYTGVPAYALAAGAILLLLGGAVLLFLGRRRSNA